RLRALPRGTHAAARDPSARRRAREAAARCGAAAAVGSRRAPRDRRRQGPRPLRLSRRPSREHDRPEAAPGACGLARGSTCSRGPRATAPPPLRGLPTVLGSGVAMASFMDASPPRRLPQRPTEELLRRVLPLVAHDPAQLGHPLAAHPEPLIAFDAERTILA